MEEVLHIRRRIDRLAHRIDRRVLRIVAAAAAEEEGLPAVRPTQTLSQQMLKIVIKQHGWCEHHEHIRPRILENAAVAGPIVMVEADIVGSDMVVVRVSMTAAEGPVCCIALDSMVLVSHREAADYREVVDHNEIAARTVTVVDRTATDQEADRATAQKDRVRMRSRRVEMQEDMGSAIGRRNAAVPGMAGTRVRPSERLSCFEKCSVHEFQRRRRQAGV